jgi:hypothetical protein
MKGGEHEQISLRALRSLLLFAMDWKSLSTPKDPPTGPEEE